MVKSRKEEPRGEDQECMRVWEEKKESTVRREGGYGKDRIGGYGKDKIGGYGKDRIGGYGKDRRSWYEKKLDKELVWVNSREKSVRDQER